MGSVQIWKENLPREKTKPKNAFDGKLWVIHQNYAYRWMFCLCGEYSNNIGKSGGEWGVLCEGRGVGKQRPCWKCYFSGYRSQKRITFRFISGEHRFVRRHIVRFKQSFNLAPHNKSFVEVSLSFFPLPLFNPCFVVGSINIRVVYTPRFVCMSRVLTQLSEVLVHDIQDEFHTTTIRSARHHFPIVFIRAAIWCDVEEFVEWQREEEGATGRGDANLL